MTTTMTRPRALPRQPHTASWRWKTAATITIWIGSAFTLFLTAFLAATGGADTTRFNMPGILIASGALAIAGACFSMSAMTRTHGERTPIAPDRGTTSR